MRKTSNKYRNMVDKSLQNFHLEAQSDCRIILVSTLQQEVNVTVSGLYPMAGFGVSGAETLGYATTTKKSLQNLL